jgi:hypothetical protein
MRLQRSLLETGCKLRPLSFCPDGRLKFVHAVLAQLRTAAVIEIANADVTWQMLGGKRRASGGMKISFAVSKLRF